MLQESVPWDRWNSKSRTNFPKVRPELYKTLEHQKETQPPLNTQLQPGKKPPVWMLLPDQAGSRGFPGGWPSCQDSTCFSSPTSLRLNSSLATLFVTRQTWLALWGPHTPASTILQNPRTSHEHRTSTAPGAGDRAVNKRQNSPPSRLITCEEGHRALSLRKSTYSHNVHQAAELVPAQFQASKQHFLPYFNLKPAELLTPKCRVAHTKPWTDNKRGNVSEMSGTQQLFNLHEPLPQQDKLCAHCLSMLSPFCSSYLPESNPAAASPWIQENGWGSGYN